ncbi:alpha/beta fold hydrolase [Amycolatopsis sp. H20-H5]|uniref:alpha/beta fold hydrolase n=1 Tax=Amycolatopsis sp. H20-H5 TaxID=3046309 RepID=UPI002DBDE6F0|nr:alpha/beta fold hydrolase [Amycolatopsis sp. H20-H5]MEC3979319.1 alpha/beta fold hydrolase [Amycolatopsis sp. H20-H5]
MPADSGELRYQVIHGYRRAYRRAGSGPAVLFIHGIGDDSSTWLSVLSALADEFTVIAPDLLGHGGSDKPRADYSVAAYACAMRDLLATLDVERVSVVGHSLGGGVAMQFAYQFPQLCERLVLVSSGGVGPEVHPLLRLATAPGTDLILPLLGALPVRTLLRRFERLLRPVDGFGIGSDFDYVVGKYVRLAESTTRQAFLRTLRSVVDWRGQVVTMLDRGYLTEGMPTMLVWGTRDRVVPSPHAQIAYEALPSSRLEIFEGAGHFPHHSAPERFLAILREFLSETEPAAHDSEKWRKLLRAGRRDRPAPSSGT